MASTTSSITACALASPAPADGRAATRSQASAVPHGVGLPTLPPPPHVAAPVRTQGRETWKTSAYYRRIARNVVAMATGEAPAEATTDLPEIVKTIQDAWDKLEDKYAMTSLAVSVAIALWGSSGLISAIDRLPLVPGILELVGIGYTGWFAYRNLIFKPDREALLGKIKCTYYDIVGSS